MLDIIGRQVNAHTLFIKLGVVIAKDANGQCWLMVCLVASIGMLLCSSVHTDSGQPAVKKACNMIFVQYPAYLCIFLLVGRGRRINCKLTRMTLSRRHD